MVETCSPYSLVQEVRCSNRYSMEYLPSRPYDVNSAHRWRVQHISLGNLYVHVWRRDSMVRRSSRAVPTYSELFSIASRAASLPKLYCVWMVMLHLRKTRSLTQTKFMVVELYISVLDKTWQRLNEYFSGYLFITSKVVSSRTVSGFNHVYSPCYFYPRVFYVYITTVLLG